MHLLVTFLTAVYFAVINSVMKKMSVTGKELDRENLARGTFSISKLKLSDFDYL